jgi:hypothetical protein
LRVYTAVQLGEVFLFFAVLVYGLVPTPDRHPSLVILGAGLLLGKAVLNILTPEGGTLFRRSIIGYGLGIALAIAGIVLIHI